MTRNETSPADLEIRVRVHFENGRTRLSYALTSPTGVARFSHREIAGPTFQGNPEELHRNLLRQIEELGDGMDPDGKVLLRSEVAHKLAGLGRDLWHQLFNPEMRQAYRRFRESVRSLHIVSDEPWIPWEMIKPFDEEGDVLLDDEFFGERFELTRWLAGDHPAPGTLEVRQLSCLWDLEELPLANEERELISGLARSNEGVREIAPPPSGVESLVLLLEEGGIGLLHFALHGTFDPALPNEAGLPLVDGSVLRPSDLHGPVQAQIRRDRPLIFLNACSAGRQAWSWTGLGGWADRWVRVCGCGAFLGPQWQVRDSAALAFARAFYASLSRGETLGQAAKLARQEARTATPGDPSWLAYAVYGHPNARALFGDSAPTLDPIPSRAPAAIREKIRSFDLLIRRKTDGFVGRQWLFDAIDGFVNNRQRGYVQILGDPGIGKTTLVAEMVRRHKHPHHFNIRAEGIQKPEQFLPNLCAQLISRFGLPYSHLPPETTRDASVLVNVLEKVSAQLKQSGKKLLVLVDALDESDPTSVTRGSNTLYLPMDLPDDVFFVVTSRRGGPPLRYACDDHKIDLQKETANNFADVRLFAQSWLGREGIQSYVRHQGLDETTFVDEIVRLSEGNFMYLHYVLPEIERGTYSDRKFDTLPSGLLNYYEDQWNRMKEGDPDAWADYKLPVLKALTIAREPISLNLVADLSEIHNPTRIHAVLQEWAGFLQPIEVQEDGERETRWRLYHESFFDFIAAREDLREAHKRAARVLWKKLYPEG